MPGQVSPATGLLSRLLDVVRQAEHPLGHDVALHLAGAPADGQGGGEQEAVVPHRRIGTERTLGREHPTGARSEEHTSELPSLMRISYAVFCLKKQKEPYTT